MVDQLSAIQTHLWVITGIIGLILVGNILCNYWRSSEDRARQRLRTLYGTEKYTDLLDAVQVTLRDEPAEASALMYKSLALYGLGRYDECRSVAETLKQKAPLYRSEALAILETLDERENEA